MELIDELSDELFKSVHDLALSKLTSSRDRAYEIGIHTARMNINGEVRRTIIPPLYVFAGKATENGVISTDIDYRIVYNNQTFPMAHVYGASGHLCLGNIPVPRFVDIHSLMTPLETLFLYNDRNLNHGNPKLDISDEIHEKVCEFAQIHQLTIPQSKQYLMYDTVWLLGAELLEQNDTQTAYELAETLYKIIFKEREQSK